MPAITIHREVTVRLQWADDATAFHVHGRGLVISRVVNELGIARTVTGALEQSLEPGRRPHLSASG
jgi:fructose-1-phosphate kinase PfkB-like protein